MSAKKWTYKYALSAVLAAILIISVTLLINPSIVPKSPTTSTFAVMLTDPPNVPAGTTSLNVTYSDIAIHLIQADGSEDWVNVSSSGTFDSLRLVNISQTIAATTIPTNSSVDKVQLTISNVEATINGTEYNVQTLSNILVLSVDARINQTLSGVLVDFNPTVIQTQSIDSNGNLVYRYVLIPSATAMMIPGPGPDQMRLGFRGPLGPDDRRQIMQAVADFSQNLTVTSASLSVSGDTTSLSVTIQNNGDTPLRVFGIALHGQFSQQQNTQMLNFPPIVAFQINGTSLLPILGPQLNQNMTQLLQNMTQLYQNFTNRQFNLTDNQMPFSFSFQGIGNGQLPPMGTVPNQIPYQMNQPDMPLGPNNGGQSVQPNILNGLFGDSDGGAVSNYVVLQPGQSVTLTYSGVMSPLQIFSFSGNTPSPVTPIVGNSYTITLAGEGLQTYTVTATQG